MIEAIKIIIIIAVMLVLYFPLLHIGKKHALGRITTVHARSYHYPDNKRNIFFVLLVIVEIVVFALLFEILNGLISLIQAIPFLGNLITSGLDKVAPQVDFVFIAIRLVLVNLLIIVAFLFTSLLMRKWLIDGIFHLSEEDRERREARRKKKEEKRKKRLAKKKKGVVEQNSDTPSDEDDPKNKRVESFEHGENPEDKKAGAEKEAPKEHSRFYRAVVGLFFRAPEYSYARPWLIRAERILQNFVYLVEIAYFALTLAIFLCVFFPLDSGFYGFLVDVIRIQNWYIYPFISILLLQEICYLFKTPIPEEPEASVGAEEISDEEMEARLNELQSVLKQRFDKEHGLRYYPEAKSEEEPPYECTNKQFASALEFIGKRMFDVSGRTVQSYMKTLDTMYGGDHIYVGAPFYSEFGEYVILYTYTRLLSGARVVFMIGNDRDAELLKKYIRSRLTEITGSSEECTWRVYTADERLDQADVYIATPNDFKNDNIVEHFPGFFEEVCNVVFIDADDIIAQESYLCCIIASRLLNGSGGRASFLFLTEQMLYGFAASTLPKFFCVERVLNMSDATQVESVSYTLWNRESANGRIYDKTGHKLTGLESIIAERAYHYGVDGIKIKTDAVLEAAERKIMEAHEVEINDFFKPIPRVNFLVYSDDYFNLAAVLFAATRFRGRKKSVAHIISRPYLLRDYFVSKASRDDFVNRATFIQPRMAEHINQHKLSLLRIFCDLTGDGRMPLSTFEARIRDVIGLAKKREDVPPCAFCAELLKTDVNVLTTDQLVSYLIAGLCDNEKTPYHKSEGHAAKDYYLVTNSNEQNGYSFVREKLIYFKHIKNMVDRAVLSNKRVELRLNDEVIGVLPYIFPKRVPLEYMVGMSIVYKNTEYEIAQITYSNAEDCDNPGMQNETCTIFLRCENVTFKNCLDTIFLRRYELGEAEPFGLIGIRHDSTSILSELRVQKMKMDFVGRTYGFYSMMSDRQTLDFYKGVEGIGRLDPEVEAANLRTLTEKKGRALMLTLTSKEDCTDGMRMLLSAVFNELLRALFPKTYRCVAVCPILQEPLPFNDENPALTPEDRIKALYPYLADPQGDFVETDPHKIRLLFINDCEEDVGVLDWIFDPVCRYIQEWLVYIYSYLHWVKAFPEKKHYIYFGGEKMPECFDLDGLLNLLQNCKTTFSDSGAHDYDTANDDVDETELRKCSFCHRTMETGRYQTFNKHRYICADCFDVIGTEDAARKVMEKVLAYLKANYPGVFARGENVKLDPPYLLGEDQVLSEFYSRVDPDERVIYMEKDLPATNAAVAILRGMIALWQKDNNLVISYADAQLYYEELKYLRSLGQDVSADWIYDHLSEELRRDIQTIADYVEEPNGGDNGGNGGDEFDEAFDEEYDEELGDLLDKTEQDETADDPNAMNEFNDATKPNAPGGLSDPIDEEDDMARAPRSSFLFMREKAKELDDIEEDTGDEPSDEDYSDDLYDPKKTPRFWKRYLRGEHAEDGNEDVHPDNEHEEEQPVGEEENAKTVSKGNAFLYWDRTKPNCPPPGFDDPEEADEEPADEEENADEEEFDEDPGVTEGSDEDETEPNEPSEEADETEEEPAEEPEEETEEEPAEEEPEEEPEPEPEEKPKKPVKGEGAEKPKKEFWLKRFFAFLFGKKRKKKKKPITPEEEEKNNPKIRVYNEMVRHAKDYDEGPFSREGVTDEELGRIFQYVICDNPELFWVHAFKWNSAEVSLIFRCKNANGKLDLKQIKRKTREIKKGARFFTRGITRRTDPYKALVTIYRRLILTLDYDTVGLNADVSSDLSRDDMIRSLHGALVEHKVVCAGYAVAFQYLMQSIGLTCAFVVSEDHPGGGCHAFNIVKIGKYCYYVDATWGDSSNTKTGEDHKNEIHYGYCCVPFREFVRTSEGDQCYHTPRKEFYPDLEELKATNHEYHRYIKAFMSRVNDDEFAKIIARQALTYKPSEMGDFIVSVRFSTYELAKCAQRTIGTAVKKAYALAERKNRKRAELLSVCTASCANPSGVLEIYFQQPQKKKKKKKDQKDA